MAARDLFYDVSFAQENLEGIHEIVRIICFPFFPMLTCLSDPILWLPARLLWGCRRWIVGAQGEELCMELSFGFPA